MLKVNDASSVVEKLEDFPKIVSTIPPAEAVPSGLAASPTGTLYNTQSPGGKPGCRDDGSGVTLCEPSESPPGSLPTV